VTIIQRVCLLCSLATFFGAFPVQVLGSPDDRDDLGRRMKHVFVIVLENEGFDVTFGPNSKAPFLSQTLPAQGGSPESILRHGSRQLGQLHCHDQRPSCHAADTQ
jgi:hypothetical protein